MVASKTLVVELYQPWKAKVDFSKDITARGATLFRNALWLLRGVAIACSRFNIRDGVRQRDTLTARMENTGELTNVGMEKEDLGLMMSTF